VSDEQAGVKWLRQQIKSNLGLARLAMGAENINAQWMEVSSGVLHTGPGTEADCWDGTWPMGDSRLTRFIAAHDPQDVIADCEAKLDILDEHSAVADDPGHCGRCQNWVYAMPAPWPCTTLRRLASAYCHRPDYTEHWPSNAQ